MAFKMKGSAFKLNNVATKSALKQTSVVSPLQQQKPDPNRAAHINEMIAGMTRNPDETTEAFNLRRRAEADEIGKNYDWKIAEAEKDQLRRDKFHKTKDTDSESKKIIDKSKTNTNPKTK